MFGISRILAGCILFCVLMVFLRKKKTAQYRKKRNCIFLLSLVFTLVMHFFPVENLFVSFSSPENSFSYIFIDEPEKVIYGANTAFAVSSNGTKSTYAIIPKVHGNWKIGLGWNTRMVVTKYVDNILISVYQYRGTEEYYIVVGSENEIVKIGDSKNSEFHSHSIYEQNGSQNIFIAFLQGYDHSYNLQINNEIYSIKE